MASKPARFREFLYSAYRRFSVASRRRRSRLTVAGSRVAAFTLAVAIVGLNTNIGTTYQLFPFLSALFAVAVAEALLFRPSLRVERRLPPYAAAHEPLRYRVRVLNLATRPLSALRLSESIEEAVPSQRAFLEQVEPGEDRRNAFDRTLLYYRWMWLVRRMRTARAPAGEYFDLGTNAAAEVEMVIEPLRRGVLRLGDVSVLKPDMFGLVDGVRRVTTGGDSTLTVLPRRYALPRLSLGGRARYQTTGSILAGNVGQSDEFIGLRDYRPGNPLRHLHWKSWARTGRPIVREFEDEYFPRYALVLDTFAPYDDRGVFEEAVSVAASFVCTLDTKESLLDLLFVGSQAYCFTSGRGVSQPQPLLEVLAAVELCTDRPFGDLAGLVCSRVRDVSACVCILLDWNDERRECVRRLRACGTEVLALVVVAPDSTLPERSGGEGVRFVRTSDVAGELARL